MGRTGLRLAVAILCVSLATMATVLAIVGATIASDVRSLATHEGDEVTRALASASAVAYSASGWDREDLHTVLHLVAQAGVAAQVRGRARQVIFSSPGFAQFPAGQVHRQPVVARGSTIGSVTVKFDHRGLAAAIRQYESLRWHVGIVAAASSALVGLVVSLLVSRTLTAPVDRLIATARAMEAGDRAARVGKVRGIAEVRELSQAFDQMAEALGEQARQRRQMAGDLAHELRAPISVLQATLESMQDGITQPTPASLGTLRDEVLRLARMTDDLRVLASEQSAELQLELGRHDLAAIAAEVADSLAGSFRAADVDLVRRLSPIDVVCDARRMHEVALNLVDNALKFTPAGGSVALETGPAPLTSRRAILRVSDTGIGIPPDELPHVSQRFFRGQQAMDVSGSGIGLAIVAQLVRAHHGRVNIVSEPGGGTQVSILLPRAEY
jgi:two-component system sensor histidine kinase BaeS